MLEPGSNTIRTLAGSGKPGLADGAGTSAQLSEPGGLCLGPGGTVLRGRHQQQPDQVLPLLMKDPLLQLADLAVLQ